MIKKGKSLIVFRVALVFSVALCGLGLYHFLLPIYQEGLLLLSRRWLSVLLAGSAGLLALTGLFIASLFQATGRGALAPRALARLARRFSRLRSWNLVCYAAIFFAASVFIFFPWYGANPPGFTSVLAIYWTSALVGSIFLKAWGQGKGGVFQRNWFETLGFSLLLTTFGYRTVIMLPDITAYPFTLGWSEASRYYYASLYFSEKLYAIDLPPTVLHPSRYLMQAVPFLWPGSPLWLHRAWQVFLWFSVTCLTAGLLVRRLATGALQSSLNTWRQINLFLIAYLFLLIGPVYYHLQIPLIVMLAGMPSFTSTRQHPWKDFFRSLLVLAIASAWCGISRVNWYPVPAMLAIAIYLLEQPLFASGAPEKKGMPVRALLTYLGRPLAWTVVGIGAAFAAQAAYIAWSGNPAKHFVSSFSSALLWYRLWPNATYPPGILPAIILVSAPMIWMAWDGLSKFRPARYHPIRLLGVGAMLLVLFIGGLVVSVKIGGGSNLHNLDAYQSLLLLVATYIFCGKLIPEPGNGALPEEQASEVEIITPDDDSLITTPENTAIGDTPDFPPPARRLRAAGMAGLISILVVFSFLVGGPRKPLPNAQDARKSLAAIIQRVEEARQQGGEVLFISNRHLLTFGYIQNTPLITDYERVFLMEMVMAGDPEYLSKFRQDLENRRFALIINEPVFVQIKDENTIFGEENNAWVRLVARHLRCYYKEDTLLRSVGIQILVPDPDPKKSKCPPQ
jgi:hypothetical protein